MVELSEWHSVKMSRDRNLKTLQCHVVNIQSSRKEQET